MLWSYDLSLSSALWPVKHILIPLIVLIKEIIKDACKSLVSLFITNFILLIVRIDHPLGHLDIMKIVPNTRRSTWGRRRSGLADECLWNESFLSHDLCDPKLLLVLCHLLSPAQATAKWEHTLLVVTVGRWVLHPEWAVDSTAVFQFYYASFCAELVVTSIAEVVSAETVEQGD